VPENANSVVALKNVIKRLEKKEDDDSSSDL
jgi:hypothetical protein